jgi:hypothetical protein
MYFGLMRFQVFTMASMKMTAFWDIAPCSLVEVDWCFRGGYYLHRQGGLMKHKSPIIGQNTAEAVPI